MAAMASGSSSMAAIFGAAGLRLSDDEKAFFRDASPVGFILFQRNCDNPDQVRALVDDFREVVGRDDAPVLIDQEGGRVARLKPPHWRAAPSALAIAQLAEQSVEAATEAVYLNALLLAVELLDLGITVDCAPVVDVPQPDAHDIIGDRALGLSVELISKLAPAAVAGFLSGGVLPVIKHIPGHGRALVDSHLSLPVVDAAIEDLSAIDFEAFRHVASAPWAMTAHVVYSALDADRPATTSADVINAVIRGDIGFDGVLVSDDLSMKALGGAMQDRASDCLAAGCDIALHCNGDMAEMKAVAEGATALSPMAVERLVRGEAMRQENLEDVDWDLAHRRFNGLMDGTARPL